MIHKRLFTYLHWYLDKMYFTHDKQNLLTIDDDYASLLKIRKDESLEFRFLYKISSHEAIKNNATKVNVSVFSRIVKQQQLINVSDGVIDSKSLINNILTNVSTAKLAVKQREEFNSVTKVSDITAKINNEIVTQLRSPTLTIGSVQQLSKTVLKSVPASSFKSSVDQKPIIQFATNTTEITSSVNSMSLMKDMIFKQGIDPSKIIEMTPRNLSSVDSFNGTLKLTKSSIIENKATNSLMNLHTLKNLETPSLPKTTADVQDETYVQVVSSEATFDVEVPVHVVIPKHAFYLEGKYNTQFHVKFELIDSKTGLSIDTVTKQLDVSQYVQAHNTPVLPPIVNVIKSSYLNRANLSIKQIDKNAKSVQVFKKNIYRSSVEIDDYILFGTFDVSFDQQTLLVQINLPIDSTAIYRVIPVGPTGIPGSTFTNVVVNPLRFKQPKQITSVAKIIDTGIQLELKNIPSGVIAIELLVSNLSIHEKISKNVNGVIFINDNIRSNDLVVVVDSNVFPNNVYHYSTKLIYASGTSDLVGGPIIEYVKQVQNKVDIKIKNVKIDKSDTPNVQFDIDSTVIDSNIDSIKSMMKQQDMLEIFSKDVSLEREFLKSLIAHNIQRINLTTGARENFGVITSTTFSDSDLRTNQSIEPLKLGNKYRYEVSVLLRSPETMFETFIKSKIDLTTKKTYNFKPSKFLHPIAVNLGILTTQQGLKLNYSKDEMSHGVVGSTEIFEVTFESDSTLVKEAIVSNLGKNIHVITWKIQGDINNIDHFLISRENNGIKTLIDISHCEFLNGNCLKYISLSKRDNGTFKYVITPIFNNYELGTSVYTNQIIVELSS